MASDSIQDEVDGVGSAALVGGDAAVHDGAASSVGGSAWSQQETWSEGLNTTTVANVVAAQDALSGANYLIFGAWLQGTESERTVQLTTRKETPDSNLVSAGSSWLRFTDVYELFVVPDPLRHVLESCSGWVRIEFPELGWVFWVKGPWQPTGILADEEAFKEAGSLIGKEKLLEEGSEEEILHKALDAVSLASATNPSPIAQAIGAGADAANAYLYWEEGDKPMAISYAASVFLPYTLMGTKAIFNEAGELVGYSIKRATVKKLGVIGVLKQLKMAQAAIRIRGELLAEIADLGCYLDFLRTDERLITRVAEGFPDAKLGEGALLGVLESNAWLADEYKWTQGELYARVREHLALVEELARDTPDLPGLDMTFNSLRIENESNIIGGIFELEWIHAHRTDLVEIQQVLVQDSGAIYQGADALFTDHVAELKAYLASSLTTETAQAWAKQVKNRLQQSLCDPKFTNVELVVSAERLGQSTLPAAFEAALAAELDALRAEFTSLSPTITVSIW